MHVTQNDRLPLRVVVQVLFFEQVRASASVQALSSHNHDSSLSLTSVDEECEKTEGEEDCQSLEKQLNHLKIKAEELSKKNSKNSRSGIQLLPSRTRRIFDKLWIVGKGQVEKSSQTSGSSISPTSVVPGDLKLPDRPSRNRRHSIS